MTALLDLDSVATHEPDIDEAKVSMRSPYVYANLTDEQHHHRQWRQATRAVMVLLSVGGMSAAVAALLCYDPATVRRWIARHDLHGVTPQRTSCLGSRHRHRGCAAAGVRCSTADAAGASIGNGENTNHAAAVTTPTTGGAPQCTLQRRPQSASPIRMDGRYLAVAASLLRSVRIHP
jgi:hypothetical protein